MNNSNKLLSDIVSFNSYAKHLQHLARRESFEESINRSMNMHLEKFPKLSKDIVKAYGLVHEDKIMPSMRGLQFGGEAVLLNNIRLYNCSFLPIVDTKCFSEILFLLLSGTGVGYSVQKHHISQLPKIQIPRESSIYIVPDSITGWAMALDQLIEAYFYNKVNPIFDFSLIRPKGSYLKTSGARAPGPEPLKHMLQKVENILMSAIGRQPTTLETHDIVCIISDCVLSGGIRRAALVSLFSADDEDMLRCKSGNWWEKYPWRARANNSAMLPRKVTTREQFEYIYKITKESGSGEPGFVWVNSLEMGFNPCLEASLSPYQFCNLGTTNLTGVTNEKEFLKRCHFTSLLCTLQAAYTDFPFLRPIWKETTERDALIGVSSTGIADSSGVITPDILRRGVKVILETNEKYAKKLGINIAQRTTVIKPEGSSSCVLGSSSGIHSRHSEFYLRRVRIVKGTSLDVYLRNTIPDMIEDDFSNSKESVITIAQQSPTGALTRDGETAMDLLTRAYSYNENWIKPGHRSGDNRNNVSVTVSMKDEEWDQVRDSMWKNRDIYSGISLLPYDGGNYKQVPFEKCDEATYIKYSKMANDIDLRQVREEEDNTKRSESLACSGGFCELTRV